MRGACLLVVAVLPFVQPAMIAAELVLPDPASEVYQAFVVSAGRQIEVEAGVRISGDLHSNGDIDLKAGSTIQGSPRQRA